MNTKYKRILIAAFILIALIAAYLLTSKSNAKVNYLTETVVKGNISQLVSATGEVSAQQIVSVGAQVSGQITKLYVKQGQQVKKGEMIAEIDSMTQMNELKTYKAKLETYKAQRVAKQIALKVAQQQYNREMKLMAKDATSKENRENAENTMAAAKAAVDEVESLIVQTEISVSTAEVNLGYTQIAAPLDGTVVSVPVEEGQTVNANQTTPTIVQIADLTRMEIKVEISEGDITKVKAGLPVTYTILSEPDKVFTATLDSIDPGLTTLTDGSYSTTSSSSLSSSSSSTSSSNAVYYYGRLLVDNTAGKLRIGMTTQNIIRINEVDDVLIVPSIALYTKDGKKHVRVLDGSTVEEREVETGISDNMNTQIISGLKQDERVISSQMAEGEVSSSSVKPRGPRL